MPVTLASTPSVLLLPKNRGLAAQVELALQSRVPKDGEIAYAMRGEDIPYLSTQLAGELRGVTAYTGEDLLEDWLSAGNALDARLQRSRVPWSDPTAIFGKPALCLIGPPNAQFGPGRARVAVCARYQNLAKRYLREFENEETSIEVALVHGSLEAVLCERISDFIVDIVVTGKTIREAGLSVRKLFFTSDLAVLETR